VFLCRLICRLRSFGIIDPHWREFDQPHLLIRPVYRHLEAPAAVLSDSLLELGPKEIHIVEYPMNGTRQALIGRKAITPLWVVALFVSLTETVLGIAVTQTQGGIQIALTVFVLVFPILIAVLFFAILFYRPYVFYPPTEFGSQTNVRDYVEAMQRTPRPNDQVYQKIQEVVRATLVSESVISELTKVLSSESNKQIEDRIEGILYSASGSAVERIREVGFITINARSVLKGFQFAIWHEHYDPNEGVPSFLTRLYSKMSLELHPYTYGKEWVLKDQQTDKTFFDMGTFYGESDKRLADVGIHAGMTLQVILLKQS
jgi:hypothetical protein